MVLTAVVFGLIVMRRSKMMEVFSPDLRKLWKEWELRAMVVISLTVQIVLIVFGNRRKYIYRTWIKCVVWSAYLLADSVATIGLGLLLNDLGQIYEEGGTVDPKSQLKAFWAPFFLLHLGGPDTITAYALEDNELYLRHVFQLGVQTAATILIFLLGWTGSHHSYLSIPMIFVGVIKYGERTWALWSASGDRLRDSMLSKPDPSSNQHKLEDECFLKHAEGFCVEVEKLNAEQTDNRDKKESSAKSSEIETAHYLFDTFKRLFADLILGFEDRDRSLSEFKYLDAEKAFHVVSIELGFMYDLLYTKARMVFTLWGLMSRAFTSTLTSIVLVIFSLMTKQQFSMVDVSITYMLLVVALLLEIYATLLMLFSDQFKWWLMEHKRISMVKAIDLFQTILVEVPRWSNYMAKYSFTCFCLKEKPGLRILRRLHLDKLREMHRYKTYELVTVDLKQAIFRHVDQKYKKLEPKSRIRDILKKYNIDWRNNEIEFDQSILIWHIATDILYYISDGQDQRAENCKMSKNLSDYMLYLLVMYPFLLPVGIGLIRFRDTEYEARNFINERMSIFSINQTQPPNNYDSENPEAVYTMKMKSGRSVLCRMLLKEKTPVLPFNVKGDRNKSVLLDARKLATVLLTEIKDKTKKWEMIRDVWLEILTYAACKSRGSQHARHLRRGGELLTHVWLLMSHFGLTEQFEISQGERVRVTVK